MFCAGVRNSVRRLWLVEGGGSVVSVLWGRVRSVMSRCLKKLIDVLKRFSGIHTAYREQDVFRSFCDARSPRGVRGKGAA